MKKFFGEEEQNFQSAQRLKTTAYFDFIISRKGKKQVTKFWLLAIENRRRPISRVLYGHSVYPKKALAQPLLAIHLRIASLLCSSNLPPDIERATLQLSVYLILQPISDTAKDVLIFSVSSYLTFSPLPHKEMMRRFFSVIVLYTCLHVASR